MVTRTKFQGFRRIAGAALALLALVSCGIFSPRDSETPSPNSVAQADPFHFQSILDRSNQMFGQQEYEELFTDDFSYVDINSGAWGKNDLIQRLRQIISSSDSVQVFWQSVGDPRNSGNTIIVTGMKYFIYKHNDSSPAAIGNSDFQIVRIAGGDNKWHISSWRDVPGTTGKSFFAPEQ
jgi:hypothetical protein